MVAFEWTHEDFISGSRLHCMSNIVDIIVSQALHITLISNEWDLAVANDLVLCLQKKRRAALTKEKQTMPMRSVIGA